MYDYFFIGEEIKKLLESKGSYHASVTLFEPLFNFIQNHGRKAMLFPFSYYMQVPVRWVIQTTSSLRYGFSDQLVPNFARAKVLSAPPLFLEGSGYVPFQFSRRLTRSSTTC
jgi:hypothetical protein